MSRRSTKKFDYQKGVYYFNVNKGFMNTITIKRMDQKKAIQAYKNYLLTQQGKVQWLGCWDGKEFSENDFDSLKHEHLPASII